MVDRYKQDENGMRYHKDGGYVVYGDYDQLRTELEQVKAERDEAKRSIDQFFHVLDEMYDIEGRAHLEALAKQWKPQNAMLVALHHIWKREPKVKQLREDLKETVRQRDLAFKILGDDFDINALTAGKGK